VVTLRDRRDGRCLYSAKGRLDEGLTRRIFDFSGYNLRPEVGPFVFLVCGTKSFRICSQHQVFQYMYACTRPRVASTRASPEGSSTFRATTFGPRFESLTFLVCSTKLLYDLVLHTKAMQ
jgi:hypothetical protein